MEIRGGKIGIFEELIVLDVSKVGCIFFFFQAEDGIRDHCVTGVQTCALPISPLGGLEMHSQKFEYNGNQLCPLSINTAQFGEK